MRNRWIYLILTLSVMVMGLLSRKVDGLPLVIEKYSGDILWALMVYLGIAFLFNKQSIKIVAFITFLFSWGIEVSQLYHAPWIDAIRHTTLGGLVLGYGFLWSDLVCYGIGIAIGIGIDYLMKSFTSLEYK